MKQLPLFILALLFPLFAIAEELETYDCVKYVIITNGTVQSLKDVTAKTDGGTISPTADGKHYWKLDEDDSITFTFEYPRGENVRNVKVFLLGYGNGNVRIRWNGSLE